MTINSIVKQTLDKHWLLHFDSNAKRTRKPVNTKRQFAQKNVSRENDGSVCRTAAPWRSRA